MNEARASWNTMYQTADGFKCQITLRDEEGEAALAPRVEKVMKSIVGRGGKPVGEKFTSPVVDEELGKCPNCGSALRWVNKIGGGRFVGCSSYKDKGCDYTRNTKEKK